MIESEREGIKHVAEKLRKTTEKIIRRRKNQRMTIFRLRSIGKKKELDDSKQTTKTLEVKMTKAITVQEEMQKNQGCFHSETRHLENKVTLICCM